MAKLPANLAEIHILFQLSRHFVLYRYLAAKVSKACGLEITWLQAYRDSVLSIANNYAGQDISYELAPAVDTSFKDHVENIWRTSGFLGPYNEKVFNEKILANILRWLSDISTANDWGEEVPPLPIYMFSVGFPWRMIDTMLADAGIKFNIPAENRTSLLEPSAVIARRFIEININAKTREAFFAEICRPPSEIELINLIQGPFTQTESLAVYALFCHDLERIKEIS